MRGTLSAANVSTVPDLSLSEDEMLLEARHPSFPGRHGSSSSELILIYLLDKVNRCRLSSFSCLTLYMFSKELSQSSCQLCLQSAAIIPTDSRVFLAENVNEKHE